MITVSGTGSLHAVAGDERPALPGSVPGLKAVHRGRGFFAELTASHETLSAVRELTVSVPVWYGADDWLAESAELVVSELMSNAVRASGEGTHPLLVVEVYAAMPGVEVRVHDACPGQPRRRNVAAGNDAAESGRGLFLLDNLTAGWDVEPSPLDYMIKMIRCRFLP